jgi:hypothetical protein
MAMVHGVCYVSVDLICGTIVSGTKLRKGHYFVGHGLTCMLRDISLGVDHEEGEG